MRLRIRTAHVADDRTPRGAHLGFEVEVGATDEHQPATLGRLDGVQSVTIHCGGREEPVTAVLTVAGVHLDLDLPLPEAAQAALRLVEKQR